MIYKTFFFKSTLIAAHMGGHASFSCGPVAEFACVLIFTGTSQQITMFQRHDDKQFFNPVISVPVIINTGTH